MERNNEPVIYRTETPAPTKPGWYWARYKNPGVAMAIEPVLVTGSGNVWIMTIDAELSANLFDWFGPVTPVREG